MEERHSVQATYPCHPMPALNIPNLRESFDKAAQKFCYPKAEDVDLPRICVVGKQSSGKSSVMEALTGRVVAWNVPAGFRS